MSDIPFYWGAVEVARISAQPLTSEERFDDLLGQTLAIDITPYVKGERIYMGCDPVTSAHIWNALRSVL